MSPAADTVPRYDVLPVGVVPIKNYRSLGCDLVECDHDLDHRVGLVGYEGEMCRVCKTTDFSRPVKLLAVVPEVSALF